MPFFEAISSTSLQVLIQKVVFLSKKKELLSTTLYRQEKLPFFIPSFTLNSGLWV
jgi:hypothetical protein